MKILTTTQRDDAWVHARVGMFTASRAKDMLAVVKSGEAAARRDLRLQLCVERLTGLPQEHGYVNADMQRGTDLEPEALAAFEALTGLLARSCGFVAHDTLMAGASPDGEVDGFAGILELKCPKSATHLSYLRSKTVPSDYRAQMTHALWITGAQWCDFLSYDPRFPHSLQVFYQRLERDEHDVARYRTMAELFLREVDQEQTDILALATSHAE